jgi:VWFA-related protein
MSLRLRATFFLFALTVVPLCSQEQSVPSFKAETRIVLVDLVVTDGKGNAVPNLEKSDVLVFENGAPQTISFFEEHKSTPTAPVKSPWMPPHIFSNFQPVQLPDSVNVLVLDWLNTQPQDQVYVRSEITKYLQSLPSNTPLAVFVLTSGLHIIQGFTSDLAELQAALNTSKGAAATQPSPLLPTDSKNSAEQTTIELMQMNNTAPVTIEAVRTEMAEHAASDTSKRIRITLQAFQQLARYLSTIPGRKNVIWFADSFPIAFFPEGGLPHDYGGELQKTGDILTTHQISIYPVSAAGLCGDPTYEAQNAGRSSERSENLTQFAMAQLAKDTGGEAFYNTNDLALAITRAVNDGSLYYTLTYTPSNRKIDGKYRKIEVKLKHEKYKLSYRRGYYADSYVDGPKPWDNTNRNSAADHLLPFVAFGLPNFDQILYKVRFLPATPQPQPSSPRAGMNLNLSGPFTRYSVDFTIAVDDLKMEITSDGVHHGDIEEMLIAYDPDGTPLNLVAHNLQLTLPPETYAAFQKSGLQLHQEIDLPDRKTYLRTAIFDANSGNIGTLQIPLVSTHSNQ